MDGMDNGQWVNAMELHGIGRAGLSTNGLAGLLGLTGILYNFGPICAERLNGLLNRQWMRPDGVGVNWKEETFRT